MWDNSVGDNRITIIDKSNPGRIYPFVEYNSTDGYEWTKGEFLYDLNLSAACVGLSEDSFNNLKLQASKIAYTDSTCSTQVNLDETTIYEEGKYFFPFPTAEKLITSEIPENGRRKIYNSDNTFDYGYVLHLELEVDASKDMITPKSGDTIGTITISIRAK